MKKLRSCFLLILGLGAHQAFAQIPAVISAPIAESQSRDQVGHQTISSILLAEGKTLAGDMATVSEQIKGVMDQTQQLHDTWYSSLLAISSGVRTYRRVTEIYDHQAAMINEFGNIMPELRSKNLSVDQLSGASTTYAHILAENIGLLSELIGVLSANSAKMSDPDRIGFINNIADRIIDQHNLMTYYSNKCRAIARMKAQADQDKASVISLTRGK
jgi:hypothetical protein